MMRFIRKGKITPKFISLVEILEKINKVAYRLALLICMDHIYNEFHVLLLCKYMRALSHILRTNELKSTKDLAYQEQMIKILDGKVKMLQNKQIPLVKILKRNKKGEEVI